MDFSWNIIIWFVFFYCFNNTRKSYVIFISPCSNKYNKNQILNSHWKEYVSIKVHPKTFDEALEVEQKYNSTLSLTSVLDGVRGQCHAPSVLHPGKTIGTRCTGGWVGSRDRLDGCRLSCTHQDSIPGPSKLYRLSKPTTLHVSSTMSKLFIVFSIKIAAYLQLHIRISGDTTHYMSQIFKVFKVKVSHCRPRRDLRASGGWDFQNFQTISAWKVAKLSALHTGHIYPSFSPPGNTGDGSSTHFC